MRKAALSAVKDDLSRFLRLAEKEEVVITRHGKPAGVLVGFVSEDAWFDYRLEHDPRFLHRIEAARTSLRRGRGIALEDFDLASSNARKARATGAGAAKRRAGVAPGGERGTRRR